MQNNFPDFHLEDLMLWKQNSEDHSFGERLEIHDFICAVV